MHKSNNNNNNNNVMIRAKLGRHGGRATIIIPKSDNVSELCNDNKREPSKL
jgi:hypothetical protein